MTSLAMAGFNVITVVFPLSPPLPIEGLNLPRMPLPFLPPTEDLDMDLMPRPIEILGSKQMVLLVAG